jgi:hypothetical protein
MTDELKPVRCGCGGEAKVDWVLEPSNCYMACVYCNKCGTKTIPFWSEDKDKAIDYAVTTWNRAMGTENICKNCKAYFVMGDCGYCKYDDEYPTADGYGCNCFSRRES